MARYKDLEKGQGMFLTVKLDEQLLPGTFEWTLNYLINKMDLSVFDKNYSNDALGAAAYPPSVLLKGIFYNYRLGNISSRRIEEACKSNIITKALCDDAEPDHATIAAFVSSNAEAINDIFVKVLMQCAELDLIKGDMFAVDGCKLPSNAAKEWSGTIDDFKKKRDDLKKLSATIIKRHKEMDKAGKKKLNKTCEDYVYDKEHQKKHIERIEKKLARLNEFLEHAESRLGADGKEIQSNITDNESAKLKSPHGYIQGYNGIAAADSANQIIVSAEVIGSVGEAEQFPKMVGSIKENMRAITGKKEPLKNAIVLADTGNFSEKSLQGAREQEVEVLIPDQQFRQRDSYFDGRKGHAGPTHYTVKDFTYNKKDNTYICPAGKVLKFSGRAKLNRSSGNRWKASVKDCRDCKLRSKCLMTRRDGNLRSGRTLLVSDKPDKNNLSQKMRDKIDDPVYRTLYGWRMQIIEPCFSDITYCKGMSRFTLRGKKKVNIQWQMYCMVHNIGKCVAPLAGIYAEKRR